MVNVSAGMVKELREKTGAGMLDCKKALQESDGDMEKAIDYLRKKGLSAAAKKSARITSEGQVSVLIADGGKLGVVWEVNCETDFVARNPDFRAFVADLGQQIAVKAPKVMKTEDGEGALMAQRWIKDENKTVAEAASSLVATIGENISPRRFLRWELGGPGLFQSYIHMGGKIGVLVEVACPAAAVGAEPVRQFAKQLAMQVAASDPLTVDRGSVPADVLTREREIYRVQVVESGKPANMIDKIVEGKLNKFYKERCLLEQIWVHDTTVNVTQVLQAVGKEVGGELSIPRFARFHLGEGLEKRSNDLAAEVAAQLEGK